VAKAFSFIVSVKGLAQQLFYKITKDDEGIITKSSLKSWNNNASRPTGYLSKSRSRRIFKPLLAEVISLAFWAK
jgi:hypothetical protein